MLSVIIPTLNEEDNIADCIQHLLGEGADCEIIVSDGGSTDRTAARAGEFAGVRVVHSARGRGRQMNQGALSASGGVLLFLHADTKLEMGWSRDLEAAMSDGALSGGAFTFRIDGGGGHFRLTELWVKLRCLVFGLPYGDQGIFVRRDIFDILCGYRDIPLMEDVDLIRRLKRAGRIAVLPARAYTSARRWEKGGWIRVSLLNQFLMLLFLMGVDPGRLAKMYYGEG